MIEVYSYDSDEIDHAVSSFEQKDHIKICKYCGKKFVAEGANWFRRKVCGRSHYSHCSICGSEFSQDGPIKNGIKLSEVCKSRECRNKFSGLRSKQAIQKKYGVDNPFQSEEIKSKIRETCLERYGVDVAVKSDIVRKHLSESLKSMSESKKEEIIKRRQQTCVETYGVDNPLKSKEIREQIKQTCLERYGVEYASQSESFRKSFSETWSGKTNEELDEIVQKRVATSRLKYGVDFPHQHPDVKAKIVDSLVNKSEEEKQDIRNRTIQTCLERYGTSSPAESEEIQDKMRQTMIDRFGVDCIFNVPGFREHSREVWLEKYGVENPLQSEELREKGRQTSLEKYGTLYPMQSEEIRQRVSQSRIRNYAATIENEGHRNNYLEFMDDPIGYVKNHFNHVPTYFEIERSIGNRCSCTIYDKVPTSLGIVDQSISSMEFELFEFLQSIDPDIKIHKHCFDIIRPKEIDLYLPQYRIGIECNPTYTHNSSLPSYSNDKPQPKDYHRIKTDLCEDADVFLFHIFGYEWNHRREVIQSMLRNLLHKNECSFYARKLQVVELTSCESKSFLDVNHRQGGVHSSVRLGLKTSSGEIVSCMTFGKIRSTIGSTRESTLGSWELVRFCNKLNTTVVGGASKLFQHFLRKYGPDKVISFSDRAHTKGNLYVTLGFTQVSTSDPGYVWVNTKTDVAYNRVSCQKQNLPKLLNEPDLDIVNQTEKQIMMSHGFVQVFDSGVIRWEYNNK